MPDIPRAEEDNPLGCSHRMKRLVALNHYSAGTTEIVWECPCGHRWTERDEP